MSFVVATIAVVWAAIFGSGRDSPSPLFDDGTTDGRQEQDCPDELMALAERRGGGLVRGVDYEYVESMDPDGDGVSCESP